jgi:hypothetical protein
MSIFSDSPYIKGPKLGEGLISFDDKSATPLSLHKIKHSIEISQDNTTYQKTTMSFMNYSNKTVEGELVFPL